ncbi:MAG: molybdopterin-containing oxidoreductase family protein [Candidatus Anammoxibacter sp.]
MPNQKKLNRRNFFKRSAAGSAMLASADAMAPRIASPLMSAVKERPAFEQYPYTEKNILRPEDGTMPDKVIASGCSFCPSNCRHLVHVKDGKVFNVYGEEKDPVQNGGLCAKGQIIPQLLYNTHRILKPMKRSGPKPGFNFKKVSWDEALKEIAEKILSIRDKDGAKAIGAKSSIRQSIEAGIMQKRFMELLGSPNTIHSGNVCDGTGGIALKTTLGLAGQTNGYGPDPITGTEDLGDSKYILWFGSNDAETHPILHAYMKRRKREIGAKWIVFDPRLTVTGNAADLHILIRAGTDMAFIYAMIFHIITKDLYDRDYVNKWVNGFNELKDFIVSKNYSPEWAEKITNISSKVIVKIAEEYASAKPAAIIANTGIAHHINGVDTSRALIFLAAIRGNIGVPGGGANFMHNSSIPIELPSIADRKPISDAGLPPFPESFIKAINTGSPYPLKALFCAGNLMTQTADTKKVENALKKLELFVSFNLFPQEDTYYADYILPTVTFYEMDHVGLRRCDRGIRWRNKVVEPIGEAKPDADIWIDLAQTMAELDTSNKPEYWKNNLTLKWKDKKFLWNEVFSKKNPTMGGMSASRMAKMATPLRWPCPNTKHPGTSVMYLDKPEWKNIWGKRFPTESGKIEIYTDNLEKSLATIGRKALPEFYTSTENPWGLPTISMQKEFMKSPVLETTEAGNLVQKVKLGVQSDPDLKKQYPQQLITGRPSAVIFHSISHWAWLPAQISADRYIQISKKLAEQIKAQSGDLVEVETLRGKIIAPVLVWDGIEANTVFIPMSYGNKQVAHEEVGRYTWDSVNILTGGELYDNLSGQHEYKSFLCRITTQPGKKIHDLMKP